MNKTRKDYQCAIAHRLAECFKDEPHKIALWLLSDNPHFGGCSPSHLIALRGEKGLEKVAKFIAASQEESGNIQEET